MTAIDRVATAQRARRAEYLAWSAGRTTHAAPTLRIVPSPGPASSPSSSATRPFPPPPRPPTPPPLAATAELAALLAGFRARDGADTDHRRRVGGELRPPSPVIATTRKGDDPELAAMLAGFRAREGRA